MPKLERELKIARPKWAALLKKCTTWVADMKKIKKLEVDVEPEVVVAPDPPVMQMSNVFPVLEL